MPGEDSLKHVAGQQGVDMLRKLFAVQLIEPQHLASNQIIANLSVIKSERDSPALILIAQQNSVRNQIVRNTVRRIAQFLNNIRLRHPL